MIRGNPGGTALCGCSREKHCTALNSTASVGDDVVVVAAVARDRTLNPG